MYWLEFYDIMFFVSCWNQPGEHFNIKDFISPAASGISTRSHSSFKLNHVHSKSSLHKHFYFNHIPRLWNKLPSINISSSSYSIKMLVLSHMYHHFVLNFDSQVPCSYHFLYPCNYVPTSIFLLILCNIRPLLINTISLLITSWVLTRVVSIPSNQ